MTLLPKSLTITVTAFICLAFLPLLPPAHAVTPGYKGKIVFRSARTGDNEVFIMNADGSGQTQLTGLLGTSKSYLPAWSADGSQIAFTSSRDGNEEVYVMNADGTNQTNITNNSAQDTNASWSPDNSQIAFDSWRNGNYEIYKMDNDGGNQTRLTNNSFVDARPSWSPDGAKIAFHSNRDGHFEIYVMNADGSSQARITNTSPGISNYNPKWSPDGTKIVFETDRDGHAEAYMMNADGSNQVRITNTSPGGAYMPAWSPDGNEILFMSETSGNFEVYSAKLDGSNRTNLSNQAGQDSQMDWAAIPNTPPIASNDTATVTQHTATPINVLGNDTDEEELSASQLFITVPPTNGTASVNLVSGEINFTPATEFTGNDSFTYKICDAFSMDRLCDTATVSITVLAAPPDPTPAATTPPPLMLRKIGSLSIVTGIYTYFYTGHRPTFQGISSPGAIITVEIHSNPIVLTATANDDGYWSVTPLDDIPNGEHAINISATQGGAVSKLGTFTLGINTGLAETGLPPWIVSIVGAIILLSARFLLIRRYIRV